MHALLLMLHSSVDMVCTIHTYLSNLRHEASNADADMDEHKKKESIVKFVAEVHDIEGEALVVLGTEVQQTTP